MGEPGSGGSGPHGSARAFVARHWHKFESKERVTVTDTIPAVQPAAGAPWADQALASMLSLRARPMSGSHWTGPERPDAIPLTGGLPDPETLPVAQLLEATRTVLARESRWALEYGGSHGFPGLRELVAARIDHQPGLGYDAANVMLTGGSAQALTVVFDTFLDLGDTVVVEAPAWGGVLRMLRSFHAKIERVSLDQHGILTDELDDTLTRLAAEGRRPKLIYTLPTFQNPMGVTATLERRRQLIEIAARHQVLILEDDAYGELRFAGQPLPSLLTLSGGDGVVRCGTFSKTIATGLRVGWITGSRAMVEATAQMRFDNGTSPLLSRVIAAYIEAGSYEPQVAKMCGVYRDKCDVILTALEERCASTMTWTKPEGGFFVWLTLPENVDMKALARAAEAEGVQYISGAGFYAGPGGEHNIRLAFSYESTDRLAEAIRRLARAVDRAGPHESRAMSNG